MTAACPACASGVPMAAQSAQQTHVPAQVFSLPTIHCSACIGAVERALIAHCDVRSARVNLSTKRLSVTGPISPDETQSIVRAAGFEIHPLDADLLEQTQDPQARDLLLRLAVAGFAMMNVMLLSVAVWSGADAATRDLFHLISAMIALPVILYSGQPFFVSAMSALRAGRLNMDVPISLAILLAGGMSLFETLNSGHHAYFDAALSLTFFLLIGRYLDHRTRSAARSAAKELSALETQTVQRLTSQGLKSTPLGEVRVGDRLRVATGARVPVDGVLISAASQMDRSLLSGESLSIPVSAGALLQAGEINQGPPLTLRATAVGEDTTLRRMASMVALAETGRNRYTALADRAAQIYAPAVHLLALGAFVAWLALTGDVRLALNIAIAVLIITCPCALGLAVPAVTTSAISRLFSAGFLVKHATALERLAEVDHAAFDKTGTLTLPSHADGIARLTAPQRSVVLGLAQASDHPVSRALAHALQNDTPAQLDAIEEHEGLGLSALWNGKRVRLGSATWLGAACEGTALQIEEGAPLSLSLVETLRPGAQAALAHLPCPAEVLTGDGPSAAARLGARLGVVVRARMSPADKHAHILQLQAAGHHVLMIGDGLNDTAALAAAHASIAPASALDASRAAADIVVLTPSLEDLPLVLRLARATRRLSKQNFAIAAGYNAIAIPIALMGYATPLAAALAMSLSSITVLANSHRVRWVK